VPGIRQVWELYTNYLFFKLIYFLPRMRLRPTIALSLVAIPLRFIATVYANRSPFKKHPAMKGAYTL
jgi:hypothetical protein